MGPDQADLVDLETKRLGRVRRRVYIVAMLLVVGVLACAWLVRTPEDTYRAISAPFFMFVLVGLVVVLWRARVPLARVELLMLVLVSAMPLSRQVWLFHVAGAAGEQWLRLLGNNYWATSGVLVLTFAIADRRRGLVTGTAVVVLSVLIAAIGVGTGLARGELPVDVIPYVLGSLMFLALFLAMMSAATIMRDQWHSALNQTAVYSRWAMTDELTGLANRRAASDLLTRECAAASRSNGALSVILGDLDRFKRVNDTAGHALGDAVLKAVALKLRITMRDSDVVTRWGGEEFLIVATRTDLEGARQLAERCRRAVEAEPLAGTRMTMTFGVAQHTHGDTPDALVSRADANLYAGKAAGRNRVVPTAGSNPENTESK